MLYTMWGLAVTLIFGQETLAVSAHDINSSNGWFADFGQKPVFFLLAKELLRQANALPSPLQSSESISGARTKWFMALCSPRRPESPKMRTLSSSSVFLWNESTAVTLTTCLWLLSNRAVVLRWGAFSLLHLTEYCVFRLDISICFCKYDSIDLCPRPDSRICLYSYLPRREDNL